MAPGEISKKYSIKIQRTTVDTSCKMKTPIKKPPSPATSSNKETGKTINKQLTDVSNSKSDSKIKINVPKSLNSPSKNSLSKAITSTTKTNSSIINTTKISSSAINTAKSSSSTLTVKQEFEKRIVNTESLVNNSVKMSSSSVQTNKITSMVRKESVSNTKSKPEIKITKPCVTIKENVSETKKATIIKKSAIQSTVVFAEDKPMQTLSPNKSTMISKPQNLLKSQSSPKGQSNTSASMLLKNSESCDSSTIQKVKPGNSKFDSIKISASSAVTKKPIMSDNKKQSNGTSSDLTPSTKKITSNKSVASISKSKESEGIKIINEDSENLITSTVSLTLSTSKKGLNTNKPVINKTKMNSILGVKQPIFKDLSLQKLSTLKPSVKKDEPVSKASVKVSNTTTNNVLDSKSTSLSLTKVSPASKAINILSKSPISKSRSPISKSIASPSISSTSKVKTPPGVSPTSKPNTSFSKTMTSRSAMSTSKHSPTSKVLPVEKSTNSSRSIIHVKTSASTAKSPQIQKTDKTNRNITNKTASPGSTSKAAKISVKSNREKLSVHNNEQSKEIKSTNIVMDIANIERLENETSHILPKKLEQQQPVEDEYSVIFEGLQVDVIRDNEDERIFNKTNTYEDRSDVSNIEDGINTLEGDFLQLQSKDANSISDLEVNTREYKMKYLSNDVLNTFTDSEQQNTEQLSDSEEIDDITEVTEETESHSNGGSRCLVENTNDIYPDSYLSDAEDYQEMVLEKENLSHSIEDNIDLFEIHQDENIQQEVKDVENLGHNDDAEINEETNYLYLQYETEENQNPREDDLDLYRSDIVLEHKISEYGDCEKSDVIEDTGITKDKNLDLLNIQNDEKTEEIEETEIFKIGIESGATLDHEILNSAINSETPMSSSGSDSDFVKIDIKIDTPYEDCYYQLETVNTNNIDNGFDNCKLELLNIEENESVSEKTDLSISPSITHAELNNYSMSYDNESEVAYDETELQNIEQTSCTHDMYEVEDSELEQDLCFSGEQYFGKNLKSCNEIIEEYSSNAEPLFDESIHRNNSENSINECVSDEIFDSSPNYDKVAQVSDNICALRCETHSENPENDENYTLDSLEEHDFILDDNEDACYENIRKEEHSEGNQNKISFQINRTKNISCNLNQIFDKKETRNENGVDSFFKSVDLQQSLERDNDPEVHNETLECNELDESICVNSVSTSEQHVNMMSVISENIEYKGEIEENTFFEDNVTQNISDEYDIKQLEEQFIEQQTEVILRTEDSEVGYDKNINCEYRDVQEIKFQDTDEIIVDDDQEFSCESENLARGSEDIESPVYIISPIDCKPKNSDHSLNILQYFEENEKVNSSTLHQTIDTSYIPNCGNYYIENINKLLVVQSLSNSDFCEQRNYQMEPHFISDVSYDNGTYFQNLSSSANNDAKYEYNPDILENKMKVEPNESLENCDNVSDMEGAVRYSDDEQSSVIENTEYEDIGDIEGKTVSEDIEDLVQDVEYNETENKNNETTNLVQIEDFTIETYFDQGNIDKNKAVNEINIVKEEDTKKSGEIRFSIEQTGNSELEVILGIEGPNSETIDSFQCKSNKKMEIQDELSSTDNENFLNSKLVSKTHDMLSFEVNDDLELYEKDFPRMTLNKLFKFECVHNRLLTYAQVVMKNIIRSKNNYNLPITEVYLQNEVEVFKNLTRIKKFQSTEKFTNSTENTKYSIKTPNLYTTELTEPSSIEQLNEPQVDEQFNFDNDIEEPEMDVDIEYRLMSKKKHRKIKLENSPTRSIVYGHKVPLKRDIHSDGPIYSEPTYDRKRFRKWGRKGIFKKEFKLLEDVPEEEDRMFVVPVWKSIWLTEI